MAEEEIQPIEATDEDLNQIRPDTDFAFLKEKGIDLLQQLSGNKWTDYNVHDPGVTILEYLCYAITDFGYRADFNIKDILTTRPDGLIDGNKNALYPIADIFTSKAITIADFRKLIIDSVDEVENAWIEPLSEDDNPDGFYKVLLQTSKKVEYDIRSNPTVKGKIIAKVMAVLNENRNICEQFKQVEILEAQEVSINARVLLNNRVNPEAVLAEIFYSIERFLYGRVQFFTLSELLQTGASVEDVVQGPKLKNGYLLDENLKPRMREISVSDINKIIINIDGVENVKGLSIGWEDMLEGQDLLVLDDGKYPVLNTTFRNAIDNYSIRIFKENFEYPIDRTRMENALRDLWAVSFRSYIIADESENRPPLPVGTFREMDQYFSIQSDFPKNYLIDEMGLPKNLPRLRKAQANQLKGYLMPFEQILAGYFSQLQHVSDLFAVDIENSRPHTYYTQPLYSVPDVDRLIKAFDQKSELVENRTEYRDRWEKFISSDNDYTRDIWRLVENANEYLRRKNRVFDHLLARFAEYVDDYSISSFRSYYGEYGGNERVRALKTKSMILHDYVSIGYNRAKGFNYQENYWDSQNFSGLERKVSLLLGIMNHEKRKLSGIIGDKSLVENKGAAKREADQPSIVQTVNWADEELVVEGAGDLGKNYSEGNFVFKGTKRTVFASALKNGIDARNYRVGPLTVAGEKVYVVLYKDPADTQWTVISKHKERTDALEALDKTTAYLIDLSVKSEGFHLLEHALLENALGEKKFGFYIRDKRGKSFLTNYSPVSYYDRFQLARDILKFGKERENYYMDRVNNQEYRIVIHNEKDEPIANSTQNFKIENYGGDEAEDATKRILRIIDLMNEQEYQFKSNVRMFTTLADGTKVDTAFFDFQATVALPDWPARFQDPGFRIHVQNTFSAHAPAHVKLNFIWLDIFAMKEFENLFDTWLTSNKNGESEQQRIDSESLAHFVLKHVGK